MMPKFALWNAWILSLPFFGIGVLFIGMKKDLAKRMSDMTAYTAKERSFTIAASVAPYPFMLATVWIPFTSKLSLLCLGVVLYLAGMALFILSLNAIIRTPRDGLFSSGPYRLSRNPLYVSATMVLLGICLATASVVLACILVISVILQHFMILAEERICIEKYGKAFESYMERAPRYLFT